MSFQQDKLAAIANAIRAKDGSTAPIQAAAFAERILSIPVETYSRDWKPDPLWWDIRSIIENDTTAGYIAKIIFLLDDNFLYDEFKGADAYKTSDDGFYEVSRNEAVVHHWQPLAYKPDSRGYRTKWMMWLYKTAAMPTLTFNGQYPIYVIAKDAAISMANFLSDRYIMQAYDHINCTYTGTSASNFLGGANNLSLQKIPDAFAGMENATNVSGAFQSPVLRRVSVRSWNWSKITSLANVLNNMKALEVIDGIIDLSKGFTAPSTFLGASFMLRELTIRGMKKSIYCNSSSVIQPDVLEDWFTNGLEDLTGQTAQNISLSIYLPKAISDELRAVAAAKNWTLS